MTATRQRKAPARGSSVDRFVETHLRVLLGPIAFGKEFLFGYALTGIYADRSTVLTFTRDGRSFDVCIEPAKEGAPCYRRTARTAIFYQGEIPDDDGRQLLDEVCARVARNEGAVAAAPRRRALQYTDGEGGRPRELVPTGAVLEIRATLRCNESCDFCNTDLGSENVITRPADVAKAIEAAPSLGYRQVCFSGGEPTLLRQLPQWVRRVKELGLEVCIQTNGVIPGDARYWERYRGPDGSPRLPDMLFVSFHTTQARKVGRITGAPGTLGRKMKAIRTAAGLGITVVLSFVITTLNMDEVAGLPAFIARRFGRSVQICFSFVAPNGRARENTWLIPRGSAVAPALASAFDSADWLGVACWLTDICGLPPCLLPMHRAHLEALTRPEPRAATLRDRVKRDSCRGCALDARCVGVWKRYADLYGLDEFAPVPA